jgi:hypothetical protein
MALRPEDFDEITKQIQRGLQGQVTIPGRQSQRLTSDLVQRVLGSQDEFLARYQEFEDEYYRVLSDPKNRRIGAAVRDLDIEKASGQIRLNYLNIQAQKELQRIYTERVMRLPELFGAAGVPGIDFPSQNFYSRALLQFDVGEGDHPGIALLRRTFFNVDKTKIGLDALSTGLTMLSSRALQNISENINFDPQGKRVLYLDTETTGVTEDSQIRQFAYRINEGEAVVKSFANEQMDIATISKSGRSTLLSQIFERISGHGRRWSQLC